jgi:ribosome-associated protein
MQEDDESLDFGPDDHGRPSKSARKREASAAQDLGVRLIALRESDLVALDLPEKLFDAIMLARRITARGGLARQRQYIGKLMRDMDTTAIEAALGAKSRATAIDAEKHKRIESWRTRLLTEGPAALDELQKWNPTANRKSLQALVTRATGARIDPGSREAASRELFRALRELFAAAP